MASRLSPTRRQALYKDASSFTVFEENRPGSSTAMGCVRSFGCGIVAGLFLLMIIPDDYLQPNAITDAARARDDNLISNIFYSDKHQGLIDNGIAVGIEDLVDQPAPSPKDEMIEEDIIEDLADSVDVSSSLIDLENDVTEDFESEPEDESQEFEIIEEEIEEVEAIYAEEPVPEEVNLTDAPTKFPTTAAPTAYQCKGNPLTKHHVPEIEAFSSVMKIFIAPEFNSAALQKCAFKAFGLTSESSDVDLKHFLTHPGFDPAIESVLADIVVLESLKRHPNRVYDVKQADLIVLDILPTLSFSIPNGFGCVDILDTHAERMSEVYQTLATSGYLELQNHLFTSLSYPIGSQIAVKMFSKDLYSALFQEPYLHPSKTIVATTNTHVYRKSLKLASKYAITIPQIANPFLDFTFTQERIPSTENYLAPWERENIFYLDEVFPSDLKALRNTFTDLKGLLGSMADNISVKQYQRMFLDPRVVRAQQMFKSRFCIILNGVDNRPGKHRAIEALVSGCIPVFIQNSPLKGNAGEGLGFRGSVDWSKIGFFFGSLTCVQDNPPQTADQLKNLALMVDSEEGRSRLNQMQLAGKKALEMLLPKKEIPNYLQEGREVTHIIEEEVENIPEKDFGEDINEEGADLVDDYNEDESEEEGEEEEGDEELESLDLRILLEDDDKFTEALLLEIALKF